MYVPDWPVSCNEGWRLLWACVCQLGERWPEAREGGFEGGLCLPLHCCCCALRCTVGVCGRPGHASCVCGRTVRVISDGDIHMQFICDWTVIHMWFACYSNEEITSNTDIGMESVGKPRKVLHLMHAILNTWSCFLLVYGCYQYQGTFLANISAHNGESIK